MLNLFYQVNMAAGALVSRVLYIDTTLIHASHRPAYQNTL